MNNDEMSALLALPEAADVTRVTEAAEVAAAAAQIAAAAAAGSDGGAGASGSASGEAGTEGGRGWGDFAWPDGYVADPETMGRFVPVARRLGLTKAAAQELALLYAELDMERGRRQAEFIAKNNDGWLREIQAHPDFGGARLRQAGEAVASVMRRFASPLLAAQIRQMNVQNWPEMFYFLARVAGALAEDRSPASAGAASGATGEKSAAQILFPGLK